MSWVLLRSLAFLCLWDDRVNVEAASTDSTSVGLMTQISDQPHDLLAVVELLKDAMRVELVPWNSTDACCRLVADLVNSLGSVLWVSLCCQARGSKLLTLEAAGGHVRLAGLIGRVLVFL